MRPSQSKTLNRTIREGKNDVARSDLAHGFVKRIYLVVSFALGRPNVLTVELLSEGLLVIDPPEVH